MQSPMQCPMQRGALRPSGSCDGPLDHECLLPEPTKWRRPALFGSEGSPAVNRPLTDARSSAKSPCTLGDVCIDGADADMASQSDGTTPRPNPRWTLLESLPPNLNGVTNECEMEREGERQRQICCTRFDPPDCTGASRVPNLDVGHSL